MGDGMVLMMDDGSPMGVNKPTSQGSINEEDFMADFDWLSGPEWRQADRACNPWILSLSTVSAASR